MAYAQLAQEEIEKGYAPRVVLVGEGNKIARVTSYEKHGTLKDMLLF